MSGGEGRCAMAGSRRGSWVACVALTALLVASLLVFAPFGGHAFADDAVDRPGLTITVVDSTSAEEIDDNTVPLSAAPSRRAQTVGPVQVGLMALVLVGCVGYARYTRRCDERAFELRQELVKAELDQAGGGASWTS